MYLLSHGLLFVVVVVSAGYLGLVVLASPTCFRRRSVGSVFPPSALLGRLSNKPKLLALPCPARVFTELCRGHTALGALQEDNAFLGLFLPISLSLVLDTVPKRSSRPSSTRRLFRKLSSLFSAYCIPLCLPRRIGCAPSLACFIVSVTNLYRLPPPYLPGGIFLSPPHSFPPRF